MVIFNCPNCEEIMKRDGVQSWRCPQCGLCAWLPPSVTYGPAARWVASNDLANWIAGGPEPEWTNDISIIGERETAE